METKTMEDKIEKKDNSLFDKRELLGLGGAKIGNWIAVDPELYKKFMVHVSRHVKRDDVTKNMVFLTGLSAYTPDPINLFLRGESSIGKSYNAVEVLKYFSKEDVWLLGALSPTALIHSRGRLVDSDGDEIDFLDKPDKKAGKEEQKIWRDRLKNSHYLIELNGKILVFLEAPHIKTFNMLRPILSHDTFSISYKFTDKTAKGSLQTQHVVIRGYPATIFCSTEESYVKDLATRSFTITPEVNAAKFLDANMLTADKAMFPWRYMPDQDFDDLKSYIQFLKEPSEEFNVKVNVPYAEALAKNFPHRFARNMRDFRHVLSLVKVSTFFHLAQRPLLVRKISARADEENPGIEDGKEVEEAYLLATKDDYNRILNLWDEIRETTETSAPGHIIKFYREVVLELAKQKDEFYCEDLVAAWNSKFEDKKSSDNVRRWVSFLCSVGYLTKVPDANDKRRNLISVIDLEEKNGKRGVFKMSVIFGLESFKEWLNTANQISSQNHVLLRANLIQKDEMTIDDVYEKYYRSEIDHDDDITASPSEASLSEKKPEKTDFQKTPQNLEFHNYKELIRLTTHFTDKCVFCQKEGPMDWQVTLHDGTWGLLCEDCGLKLEKQMREAD